MPEVTTAVDDARAIHPIGIAGLVFSAPSKAFAEVKKAPVWWVPFLLASAVALAYAYVLLHRVGLATLVEQTIRQSPRLESQIASSTPETAALIRHRIELNFKIFSYAAPLVSLLMGLACAGILLATANFGAAGRATYKQMLGVWFYGTLPLTLFALLVIVGIYTGVASDPFDIRNPIGTNPGFYLTDSDLPKSLVAFLGSIDIFAIWTAALLAIGISTVAGIKRGIAWMLVLGWWLVYILIAKVAPAAFGG